MTHLEQLCGRENMMNHDLRQPSSVIASLSKRGLVHNHSCKNDFTLDVKEISFSHERMGTKTRFYNQGKGNSEMALFFYYSIAKFFFIFKSISDSSRERSASFSPESLVTITHE